MIFRHVGWGVMHEVIQRVVELRVKFGDRARILI